MNRLFEFCSIELFQRLADRKIPTRLLSITSASISDRFDLCGSESSAVLALGRVSGWACNGTQLVIWPLGVSKCRGAKGFRSRDNRGLNRRHRNM